MCPLLTCIAASLLGIDVGWQPLPEGGMEYIIQIPPEALESLRDGDLLQSDVPASVKDVRHYRIQVGRESLKRLLPPPSAEAERRPDDAASMPPALPAKPPAEHQVTFAPQPVAGAKPETKPDAEPPPQAEEPAPPWSLLTVVALVLFASLGGNVFLGWTTWDVHRRYRALVERLRPGAAGSPLGGLASE